MKITIHRGAEEIGGNCIELESEGSRILLDYGTPLPKIDPVTHKNVEVPMRKAELNIPGLYSKTGSKIDGILISHTHQDHYGMLFGKEVIPDVYMTPTMEDIIRITGRMTPGHKNLKAKVQYFKKGRKFGVGKFKITAWLMDHSASESFAFVIDAEGKRVIYTGDYREHGHRENAFKSFYNEDFGPVELILTEGTHTDVEIGENEKDVMSKIEKEIKDGALYVMCAGQNTDLLCSLAGIADKKKRFLLADGYVVLVLEALKARLNLKIPGLHDDYLKILPTPTTNNVKKYYPDFYKKIESKIVSWDWVNKNISKAIIPVRTWSEKWVKDKIKDFKSGVFVYSMWEGYTEEVGFKATIDAFKELGMEKKALHVSGHAYFSTIKKLMEKKNPRYIIPVHTEHPEIFKSAFGEKVKILKNGGTIEI